MDVATALRRWWQDRRPRHLHTRIAHYRSQLIEAKASINRWKLENNRIRRNVPVPSVLRDLLNARALTFVTRSEGPEARARHDAMREASSAYRDAVAAAERPPVDIAEPVTIYGLQWWVPTDPRMPDRAKRAQEQTLPLRIIAQTREVSVGGVMLDIGANIGRTAIPRVILGDVRMVYAAEPDPLNYRCLVQNVVDNHVRGFVLPDNVAVGATNGTARLRRAKYIGGHHLIPGEPPKPSPNIIDVPIVTLDAWVARLNVDVDAISFVKLDTQGWEPQVLLGAPRLLAYAHIAWQLEVDPPLLRSAGADPADLIGMLERHFSHFIDLRRDAPGSRVRWISDLRSALEYLGEASDSKTDLVVYRVPGR